MRMSMKRFGVTRLTGPAFLALGVAVAVQCVASLDVRAQTNTSEIPDLVGVWDGGLSLRLRSIL